MSDTPLIDGFLADPGRAGLARYEAATAETALYLGRFVGREAGIVPYLAHNVVEESAEALASYSDYMLRLLGISGPMSDELETNLQKEVGDMTYWLGQTALQSGNSLRTIAGGQMETHGYTPHRIDGDILFDDYQRFAMQSPAIGTRRNKWGNKVTTERNALFTLTTMGRELLEAADIDMYHPLAATSTAKVGLDQAVGSLLWWAADVSGRRLKVPFSVIAVQNLNKLRSRKARGVILQGRGDNR